MANEIGNTELSATKQEIIAEIAQRALVQQSKFLGTIRDVSNRAVKGASSISFPNYGSLFTVENRASGVAGLNQNPSFGKDTMALDVRAHIQWLIDSDDEIESTLDVQRELIQHAAQEHGRDLDARVITAMEADAITTTTAGDLTQPVILEMQQVLMQNKASLDKCYLQVSPKQHAKLLAIDPFISADKYGSAIIPAGVLGTIYGVNIVLNTELAADQYFMYEMDGFAVGFQRQPQFDEVNAPSFGAGARQQVLTQKYGLKSLQVGVPGAFLADGATPITTQAAHIVKDNNI
jgi:hypothetical protein